MSKFALLQPLNQRFEVAETETLLEAGLRAGLALNYGCSNGNCGLCKARVVRGEVSKLRHHDYVFSDAEKTQNYALMCSCGAHTDVELEANVAAHVNEIQLHDIPARVHALKPLTADILLMHLQTPRSNRLRFLAGQSVALSIEDDANAYPISSCPCDDRNLHFHVYRDDANPFARRIFDRVRVGDTVNVYGPVGEFVLHQTSTRPIVLLACDRGFAPIKSLAEHAMALEHAPAIFLYWFSKSQDGHYLANACRAWADALDTFHFQEIVVATANDAQRENLLVSVLGRHADLKGFDFYIAGPQPFVVSSSAILSLKGIDQTHFISMVL
ncbi:MAG: 2Fe-2S iron-sulfur cluster-binding protein [Gammaproteobacteria bacterium]|nr:2Fe-2S iron-sulfur cluster-binding protein [Gammaproteobacteria bacterium]